MTSVQSNKSKSKKSKKADLSSDEKIDQIMKDITLKRPRNPYTHFVLNEVDQIKSKNKDKKISIKELSANCSEKWKKLKNNERKKYEKMFEEEKAKYKSDIELVRHYLFKDFNSNVKHPHPPTAYRIYLNEKLREGFEQGSDPKEVKKEASSKWAKMSEEEKGVYYDKKKENDDWFMKANKINKITPISLFIQNKIEEAKKMLKEPLSIKEIAPAWKKLSKNEKKSYEKYAQELNEEKEKLQDLYEITHGIKPKRPCGAFRMFLQEKAKNGEIKNLNDCHEMWKKLSEEKKDEYLTKSHRCLLAYRYKKMIYNKKIKKMLPKKPLGALQQYLKEKKGQKPPEGEKWLNHWKSVFSSLSEDKKKKYEEKADKAKERYDKKMLQFESKVFDMPKKPVSGFILYLSDRMPDIRKENPNQPIQVSLKQIAKEWMDEKIVDPKLYNICAERDKIRFKMQLKEFQKKGYYTKLDEKKEDEDEVERKSKSKKRSSSKVSSQTTKKNKNSISKNKTQKVISRSRSRSKKSQKVGKSQKSKK